MRPAAFLLAALAACGAYEVPHDAGEVIVELTACPEGGPCAAAADGFSLTAVRICTIEDGPRADPLKARLQLSAGQWQFGSDASDRTKTEVSLTADRCAQPVFVAPTVAQTVTVRAELAGYVRLATHTFVGAGADDVIPTLRICPDATCDDRADGTSQLPVRVCAADTDRPTDLKATLRLSAGAWRFPSGSDATRTEITLGAQACADVPMVAPRIAGNVTVQAELAGFTRTDSRLLHAAALDRVDLGASAALPAGAGTVEIAATVHARTGQPSIDTQVVFEVVDVQPAGAVAYFPAPQQLVGTSGARVTATLVKAAAAQVVEVRATTTPTPPPGDLEPPVPVQSARLSLRSAP